MSSTFFGDLLSSLLLFSSDEHLSLEQQASSPPSRSVEEILTFRAIEGILLVVRFFAIIYFLTQAYTHSRYQGEKQDVYTFATFLFLGLSLITFFVNRLSQLLE
jgi:hypothetical protein